MDNDQLHDSLSDRYQRVDPLRFGMIYQKVNDMEKKIDKLEGQLGILEGQMDELLGLANRSKGALWLGMAIISGVSIIIGHFLTWRSN